MKLTKANEVRIKKNFFDALTWPPQLSNQNPIERVWALVKHKLKQ